MLYIERRVGEKQAIALSVYSCDLFLISSHIQR